MSVILRKPLIALAVASLLISLGCLITGLLLGDGALNALGCLFSGVTLASYLWVTKPQGHQTLLYAVFSLMAGLALYANLAWILWALKLPMDLGTVRDGRMAEHFWLGPATLVYAVICYAAHQLDVRHRARSRTKGE